MAPGKTQTVEKAYKAQRASAACMVRTVQGKDKKGYSMSIQINLESAIHELVGEFLREPYQFFTEADAVARFRQLLETDSMINQTIESKDGFQISTIHEEFPTFFRFDDANPFSRLEADSGASRGHYDIVIVEPDFIRAHTAETVKNRNISSIRDTGIQPFKAVIEFKLDDKGWSSGTSKGVLAEIGKLILSKNEAELRYFVVLMRYTASTNRRWDEYWPTVLEAASAKVGVNSIFATHWISKEKAPHVQSFGDWLSPT